MHLAILRLSASTADLAKLNVVGCCGKRGETSNTREGGYNGSHHGIPDPPGAVLYSRAGWLAEHHHVGVRVVVDVVDVAVVLVRHNRHVRLVPGAVALPVGVGVVVIVLYIAVVVAT